MIHIKNVSKRYEGSEGIDNVDITIEKGSIYGLLGSNGAGKTTFLKILAGILKQERGDVFVSGQPVFENTRIKDKVFFIPDSPAFFPQYSVKQMAVFYRSTYTGWSDDRFQQLHDVFKIDVNKKIHKFSKGIQRQAAFWLALSTMPEILILDEPMDGLDPVIRKKVKSLLIGDVAEREMTVLISSHNLREVEDLCDHIGILHKGKLLLEKELDDLKSDVHKVQVAFKEEAPDGLFNGMHILDKVTRGSVLLCIVRGKKEEIITRITAYKPVIFDMLPLTLEEIFIYEMGDAGYAIKNILV